MTLSASQPIEIVGLCINCTSSASLLVTFFVILMGLALAARLERHKTAEVAFAAETTGRQRLNLTCPSLVKGIATIQLIGRNLPASRGSEQKNLDLTPKLENLLVSFR